MLGPGNKGEHLIRAPMISEALIEVVLPKRSAVDRVKACGLVSSEAEWIVDVKLPEVRPLERN